MSLHGPIAFDGREENLTNDQMFHAARALNGSRRVPRVDRLTTVS
jgi:hypothetical protein